MKWITGITVVSLLGSLMLGGCDWGTTNSTGLEVVNEPPPGSGQAYLNKTTIRSETGGQADNAVDAAMEWAKKYAEASTKRDQLLQENRQLRQKQQTFQQHVTKLKLELNRAEAELAQANSMLLEMKTELEKWKTSVLGFRDEIRQSQKAQLDALVRVLTLIGGEIEKTPTTQPANRADAKDAKEKTGGAT